MTGSEAMPSDALAVRARIEHKWEDVVSVLDMRKAQIQRPSSTRTIAEQILPWSASRQSSQQR